MCGGTHSVNTGPLIMPRLSRVHPYPAMMPDELVVELVREYGGARVLDPFCGTGRVCVAAAEEGAVGIGMDVNPLAVLIAYAKSRSTEVDDLSLVLAELLEARNAGLLASAGSVTPSAGRRVTWFGERAARELGEIVCAINAASRRWPTRLILTVILSATAREVSFARQDQWKLHRLGRIARGRMRQDAWGIFERRVRSAWGEVVTLDKLEGNCRFVIGDARNAEVLLKRVTSDGYVDTIITSPPYGDSQTTVQYGAMSSLCMDVVARVRFFLQFRIVGGAVDRAGLGGSMSIDARDSKRMLSEYWAGGVENPQCRKAGAYVHDLVDRIRATARCLRPGGLFVTVIGRRLVGGWRLRSDEVIHDTLAKIGFSRVTCRRRRIMAKVTPPRINRMARGEMTRGRRRVRTMREEWILVHRAP